MKMRKGFTLVELLIVIVIIGILAAAMLLSSGSATAAAEASNIVSDLRTMKTAILMFYADSMDEVNKAGFDVKTTLSSAKLPVVLGKYVDNPEKYASGKYAVVEGGGKWYAGYDLAGVITEVKEKLQGKAKNTGLLGSSAIGNAPDGAVFKAADNAVWMIAR